MVQRLVRNFMAATPPLFAATSRVLDSIRAVLSGYGIRANELDHAIRMLRGMIHSYALLQATHAFQWITTRMRALPG
ncbi:MAG: WHG domain-containing protein [Rhodanobacter sp.]